MSPLPPHFTLLQVIPRLDTGGAEQTTLDVAAAVVAAGGRAIVVSDGGRMSGALTETGAELISMPVHSKNMAIMIRNAVALARLIRRERVSVVHVRSRAPAFSALWAARRTRTPVLATYHGIYSSGSPIKRWYNGVMTRGDMVIANSAYTREHLLAEHKLNPAKVIAIPRGIDLVRFDPDAIAPGRVADLRKRWRIDPEDHRLKLLLAGRLTRWKGQRLAVEVLAKLKAAGVDDLLLILAGDNQGRVNYQSALEATIRAFGLESQVRIVGNCADMPAAYLLCDLALAPSLEPEAFGRTAAEAQAMARPVIAADHGATRETVDPGRTGWLVAPGDVDAWTNALSEAIAIGPKGRAAMGAAAQTRIRSLYSVQTMTSATLGVYLDMLEKRPMSRSSAEMRKILIIKLGALGDFIQSMAAMEQIRRAHPQARITLLTTPFFVDFAQASGLFDAVESDGRPKGFKANLALFARLRRARYDRVYDLQNLFANLQLFLCLPAVRAPMVGYFTRCVAQA